MRVRGGTYSIMQHSPRQFWFSVAGLIASIVGATVLVMSPALSGPAATAVPTSHSHKLNPSTTTPIVPRRAIALPPVAWVPDHLVVTVAPGDTNSAAATGTLTVPAGLGVVVLRQTLQAHVSDSLAPYITVSPNLLPQAVPLSITSTNPVEQTFTFTAVVPAGTAYGSIDGALEFQPIQPLVSNAPALPPVSLPISLNVWPVVNTGSLSFNYPAEILENGGTVGDPLVSTDEAGISFVDVPISTPGGAPLVDFTIVIDPNVHGLPLESWFADQIDPDGLLRSAGTFRAETLPDGKQMMVLAAPFPPDYPDPIAVFAYVMAPGGGEVAGISLGQDNNLESLGYSTHESRQALERSIATTFVFH